MGMGKKLDALRGRSFSTSKFNALVNLAISRLAVLRNQRRARYNLARSDIVQLLHLGHHDRSLLRVEQVIKEQNMLDVFVMMEGYCNLMAERINLIEQAKECPEELKEAISTLLYASTRCGEFPELQEMRATFTSQYGKEFVARATELRNNCGVNHRMIQKLSTRQPTLENRLKVLKEIASENNVVLQLDEDSSMTAEEKFETEQKQRQPKPAVATTSGGSKAGDSLHNFHEEIEDMEGMSDSMKTPRKYKDVADAAEAAFKSAAYAAAAARAAVELSRSESHDPDDQNSLGSRKRKVTDKYEAMNSQLQTTEDDNLSTEDQNVVMGLEKVHPIQNYDSESEVEEIHGEKREEESEESKTAITSDSDEDVLEGNRISIDELGETRKTEDNGISFDESNSETGNEQGGVLSSRNHESGLDMKPSVLMNEDLGSKKSDPVMDDDLPETNDAKLYQSEKKTRIGFRAGLKARLRAWKS